jgi:hypothetical protein
MYQLLTAKPVSETIKKAPMAPITTSAGSAPLGWFL